MDRIELDEELELEAYEKKQFKPLNLSQDRFSRPKLSRTPTTKETALCDEIWRHFGKSIPFPRLMTAIKYKGYQFVYECYNEVKQSAARNPAALFQWKLKQVKVPLNPQ